MRFSQAWGLHVREPMLDVRLFRNARFSAASGSITLAFFAMFGSVFFLTQYLQSVLGYSPLEAGVRVLPVAAGLMIAGPTSARLTERLGTKLVVALGLVLIAGGLGLVALYEVDSGFGLIAAAELVLGLGIGTAMAPATESVMGSLPVAKASVGSAVNDATRTTGGALGVAVLGSLVSSGYRADMDGALTGLPSAAAAAAHDSLNGALGLGDGHLAGVAREASSAGCTRPRSWPPRSRSPGR